MSKTLIPRSPSSLDHNLSPTSLRMSLSPQLTSQRSRRSSSSVSSDTRSPKSGRSYSQNQGIIHLSLDLSMHTNSASGVPRDIPIPPRGTLNIGATNVEDSPQLLASSVGEQIGSQLVPSISNISLLSLNQHQQQQLQQHFLATDNNLDTSNNLNSSVNATMNPQDLTSRLNSSAQRHLHFQRGPTSNIQLATNTLTGSRKSSFNSPTLQGPQFFNPTQARSAKIRRSSSNAAQLQQQKQQSFFASRSKRGSMDDLQAPESPTLAPISLAGSPSNFLLSHSSPPNSLKASSVLSNIQFPMTRFNNLNTPPRPSSSRQNTQMKGSNNRYTDDNIPDLSIPIGRGNSLSESIGGRSPQLSPISTTLPPMTPLALSGTGLASRSNSTVMIDDEDDDDNNGVDNDEPNRAIPNIASSNQQACNDTPQLNHLFNKDRRMFSRRFRSNDDEILRNEDSISTLMNNSSREYLTDNDCIFGEPTDD